MTALSGRAQRVQPRALPVDQLVRTDQSLYTTASVVRFSAYMSCPIRKQRPGPVLTLASIASTPVSSFALAVLFLSDTASRVEAITRG